MLPVLPPKETSSKTSPSGSTIAMRTSLFVEHRPTWPWSIGVQCWKPIRSSLTRVFSGTVNPISSPPFAVVVGFLHVHGAAIVGGLGLLDPDGLHVCPGPVAVGSDAAGRREAETDHGQHNRNEPPAIDRGSFGASANVSPTRASGDGPEWLPHPSRRPLVYNGS